MNANTSIAITFLGFFTFASIGMMNGCGNSQATTQILAKEKTKQLELQWKIDSTKAAQSKPIK